MRNKILLALLLLFGLGIGNSALASHYLGATLNYECLGGNIYRVHLYYYADCQGLTPSPASVSAVGIGTGCTAPAISAWTLVSSNEANYLAPSLPTTCTTGSIPGVREYHYTANFDFSGVSCTQYRLKYTECCRVGSFTNIMNPNTTSIGIQSEGIDLSLSACNSSPMWRTAPPHFVPINQASNFDLGATDADGDSLVYYLVDPLNNAMAPVPFNSGYSYSSPMGTNWNVQLNGTTGVLSVTPLSGNQQFADIAMKVFEYRNGLLIGSVMREFSLYVLNGLPSNQMPTISGPFNFSNARLIGNTLVVAPGSSICVDFWGQDADPGQATQLSWLSDLPGASLTDTFGMGPDTITAVSAWARLCWTAPANFGVDTVTITAIDPSQLLNNMVIQPYEILIGDTSLVWPGDADNNLVADAFDLLPIGLAFGASGSARTGGSNVWVGQEVLPWNDTLVGGVDKHFADCDGSGLVDLDDTLAITLNYGLTHSKGNLPVARGSSVDAPLTITLPDSATVGDTITAIISLGDNIVPASNIYGYAFRLNYDPSLIDSSTFWIDFDNSWIGNSNNSLDLARNIAPNFICDAAQVRTTHTAVSGMGQIARAHFVIIDNIDGKRALADSATLNLFFSDVKIVDLNGNVVAVDAQPASMVVYDYTVDVPTTSVAAEVKLFPNPAHNSIQIKSIRNDLEAVEIMSLQGQLLYANTEIGSNHLRLDLRSFAKGMYFVRIQTQGSWTTRRIILE